MTVFQDASRQARGRDSKAPIPRPSTSQPLSKNDVIWIPYQERSQGELQVVMEEVA